MSSRKSCSWNWVPLASVTEKIGSGATPAGGKDSYKELGVALIRSLNVHDLDFRYENLARLDEVQAKQLSNVTVERGDVLLNITGASVARCAVVPNEVLPARVNQHVSILRPIKQALDSRFLAYFLVSGEAKSALLGIGSGAGSTRQALTKAQLEEFLVPAPPIDEQKRIVAALDQAFAALDRAHANAEANLKAADGLLERALDASFQLVETRSTSMALQEAAHPDCSLSYGIVQPGDDTDDGLPIVRPVDLTQREIGLAGLKRIDPEAARGYSRTTLQGGELLLCVRGSTGTVSVASEELAGANVTRGIVPIRFDASRVLRDFAYFQFRSSRIREQIAEKTYGAALMQINIKDLRGLQLLVPELEEQRELVGRCEAVLADAEALCRSYEAQLADIAELRQSLLQAAFSGQLS